MLTKRIVWVCLLNGKGRCAMKGSREVYARFNEELARRGLQEVLVTPIGCTDRHDYGPAVSIDPESVWYCGVKPEDVPEIVEQHLVKGQLVERLRCAS